MGIRAVFHLFLVALLALGTLGLVEWKNRIEFSGRAHASNSHPDVQICQSIDVQVIGNQFRWDFRYPGKDGKLNTADDTYSERKLYLPPNKNVTFHITSEDYVYILGIPLNENGSRNVEKKRQIAVPEMTHFIEYQFTNSGEYDLMVDPLCGFQSLHDPKMGQIIVTENHPFRNLFPGESSIQ